MSNTLEERARNCGIIFDQAKKRAAKQFPESEPDYVILKLIEQQEALIDKGRAKLQEGTTVREHMLSGGPSF